MIDSFEQNRCKDGAPGQTTVLLSWLKLPQAGYEVAEGVISDPSPLRWSSAEVSADNLAQAASPSSKTRHRDEAASFK